MKKTKIDWCDCTVNPVVGCPNGCEYCYGQKMNTRFKCVKDWRKPQFFPERLKAFESKTPKSVFIDSMSDIGCWQQEWFNQVADVMNANKQHSYIALTKRFERFNDLTVRYNRGLICNLYVGITITTQQQANDVSYMPNFYSIEPILEPITLKILPRTIIIGVETGNRKGKIIPQKEWIDSLVRQMDEYKLTVFMKESLRKIMGDDFRQDKLPWEAHNERD